MDIAATIGTVTQGISIAKALRAVEKSYDSATYRAQIADLLDALTDAKLALVEAKQELASKEGEIADLKAAFETEQKLVIGDGDYKYFADGAGKPKGFPVCPTCVTKDNRVVQLKEDGDYNAGKCPACATRFKPVTNYLANGLTAAEQRSQNMENALSRLNSRPSPYY